MTRLFPALPAAAAMAVLAGPAAAESYACAYVRACVPDGLCAPHETGLTLFAPQVAVEGEGNANDGADQTPGTVVEGSDSGAGGTQQFGADQQGSVHWGIQIVPVFEPARDRDDSTRAFLSLGSSEYVLTLLPDLTSELAYFVNSELVSTLEGACLPIGEDDGDA
ncbi:hypothetical protein [Histidinibacterium lentulum]|uniref:Uncharacterized protein n=1 Tax=Histidinibacterium lentulum TaxID=2480588 RepID=A0A3N2R981_9RHOB|nr:hypothetical protein [Histidinibacterium lentulum]ROU03977.1 hypothetical protein EAT49_00815 [Histidinibacterium lentulum]